MQIYDELKNNNYLWELFTKKEEYNSKNVDKHGRFISKSSSYKDILYPYVSDYLIKKDLLNNEYPENKNFAIVLTHDVDDINISNQHLLRSFIPFPLNRDLLGFKPVLKERLMGKKSSYNNFKNILKLEKKYNAKSSFYFLATEKDIFGNKYKIENILNDIFFVLDNDCEVGLHTSYYAFDKYEEIKGEKEKIEKLIKKKLKGVRNHLLRFRIPKSWEILSKVGFDYDTTFGYHDRIGFRNGICHPFKPFNILTNKQIDIIEIPLGISDVALFSYMRKNASESWTLIKKLIDSTEKLNGVLTILWHNWTFCYPASFAGLFGKEWTRLYEKILEYSNERNAWLTSGEKLSKFFSEIY